MKMGVTAFERSGTQPHACPISVLSNILLNVDDKKKSIFTSCIERYFVANEINVILRFGVPRMTLPAILRININICPHILYR